MKQKLFLAGLMSVVLAGSALAQGADDAAGQNGQQLPDVDVDQPAQQQPAQQQQAQPEPQPEPQPQQQAEPAPEPSYDPEPTGYQEDDFADAPAAATAPTTQAPPNSPYGAANSGGAAQRAYNGATSPVNSKQLTPTNLENFSSAATNVTPEDIVEERPFHVNELLYRIPGTYSTNDDGAGHHGGMAARGSPPRRSRKLLVMEDGQSVNLALWLDPSVHYFAPIDRIESFEVLRGSVIAHGPNNNFAVVNARNLSPFGPNETVISSAIGFTQSDGGSFITPEDAEDGEDPTIMGGDTDISARWHVHTRQTIGNVGLVFSYTGHNIQGAWDTERLRVNDFYGAIGWKGTNQDLTVSILHARQRDNYDESNLEGEDDEGFEDGDVEAAFGNLGHCKLCYAPGARHNEYFGDIWRGQITHNLYVDRDTTITTRLYAKRHRRDRYQIVSLESNPGSEDEDDAPAFIPGDDGLFDVEAGENSMFGRLRTFRNIGADIRGEWANLPFTSGMTQTIQAGIRYEYQDMTNRNFLGLDNQILSDGDKTGLTIFQRDLDANTFSAFIQSDIKVSNNLNIVPGVRFEYYKVKRQNGVVAVEEGEAEEEDDCDNFDDECLVIEGIDRNPIPRESFDNFHVLPGISFAYSGLQRTTIFGGYHRGMSTGVLRNEDFPVDDEIGDNFQLGVRSSAINGVTFEIAGFYQLIEDYQFGASFSSAGDRSFGRADEVEIRGVEMYGRVDSKPIVGGDLNFFFEGTYTYQPGKFKKGTIVVEDEDTGDEEVINLKGNHLPEVPFHVAALTLGVENKTSAGWLWDASITWTYRSEFFTDEVNTPFGGDAEGESGEVPDIWLLSARFNMDIGNTGASIFVSGHNLLDKHYITDREDGLKPGQGRTIWTGFKYKF